MHKFCIPHILGLHACGDDTKSNLIRIEVITHVSLGKSLKDLLDVYELNVSSFTILGIFIS
jgi:hypothetical protein